ncbi:MAG: hypothetical protein HKO87_07885 [Acidimicrobiia bacterium]|nr:hypothetical protein [Acidimicrobiia bacterium]NNK92338.1 hypothetical protein [Acidimicrobiia bacterium]
MDLALAVTAAIVAMVFASELGGSHRERPRDHARMWRLGMAAYSAGSWALALGLAFEWQGPIFRFFYFFGAIANIPLLAVGSVYLAGGTRWGRVVERGALALIGVGLVVTMAAAFVGEVPPSGVPDGSELFAWTFDFDGATLPGPRVFAAVSGGVSSLVIIGLSLRSIARTWRKRPHVARGNGLIIAGIVAPALGGTLTALGESTSLALFLLLGALLLWAGYRVSSTGALRPAPTAAESGR